MSDVIQGLDLITKLLPQLKSFTGARRREYFTQFIEPSFGALENIHNFYLELISRTRERLAKLLKRYEVPTCRSQEISLSLKQLEDLERVLAYFARKRRKDELLRDSLRQDTRQMLSCITWAEEQRYLASIGEYFLGDYRMPLHDQSIERITEYLLRYGGDAQWDTPSSELAFRLLDIPDVRSAIELLDNMHNRLNRRYMEIRLCFNAVRHIIIAKT